MSFCTSTSSRPAGQIFMLAVHATTKHDPCLSVRIVNFSKKLLSVQSQNLKKKTFSTRDCQSRHVILYVNFLQTCRTNFHACGSRDDQTRPLSERANCQFLKKNEFRRIVRISKKRPFLPGTVNHDMSFCTSTSSGPAGQIFMLAGHATTKLDPCLSVRIVNFSKKRLSVQSQNLKKKTFSTWDCQSRHVILYVNFLRTCRTNFHACRSRDDQIRPLFERANCQFLKKNEF